MSKQLAVLLLLVSILVIAGIAMSPWMIAISDPVNDV